jgi:DNA-binding CsgD family transcriptional regulator
MDEVRETAARAEDGALLERDRELEAIASAVRRACGGEGSLVLVEGEAGIGKTALLAAAKADAAAGDMTVLHGAGSDAEQAFAFGVALQLFEGELNARGARREKLLAGPAARVERMLTGGPETGSAPLDLFPLLHGLFWLTTNLCEDAGPLLLLVDDVHWADEPTLHFIRYLAQRIVELPVAIVAARRPIAGGSGHLDAVASSIAELAPLSPDAGAGLVRRRAPAAGEELASACMEVTGGNPFLLEELLAEIVSGRDVTMSAEAVRGLVPEAVRRMVVLRLAGLGPDCHSLARALAILSDRGDLGAAARVAGLDDGSAAAAVERLTDARVLDPGRPGRFRHALIRAAIERELPASTRSELHRRAAAILRAAGAPVEVVAGHVGTASPQGDPEAVETLRAAAERAAAAKAHEEAVAMLERALEEPPSAEIVPVVLTELGRAQAPLDADAARRSLEEAIALRPPAETSVGALLELAHMHYAHGRLGDASEAIEQGLELVEGRVELRELELRLEAAYYSVATLVPDRSEAAQARGRRLAANLVQSESLTPGERSAMVAIGLSGTIAGEPAEANVQLVKRAIEGGRLIEEATADDPVVYMATGVLFYSDELALEIEFASEAIADAQRRGSVLAFATASYARGWPYLLSGSLAEATADFEAALDARRYGWEQYVAPAYAGLARCLVEAGEPELALERLDELGPDWQRNPVWSQAWGARGHALLALGRRDEALAAIETWGSSMPIPNPAVVGEWRSSKAIVLAQMGRREEGTELARQEIELTRAFGTPRSTGVALRGLGLALGGEDGVEQLKRSVAALEQAEAQLELCRSMVELGAAIRRAGRPTEAREALRKALDLADRRRLPALAERAREELRAAGGRPRRAALSGVDSLTPGELRVVEMAAAGMTNREIAQDLFVTVKAVQWHLGNAYRKLDVSGRGELAGALERRKPPDG